jgi:ubiquinone/menaquinone biosynthesis C-methylase UbiE
MKLVSILFIAGILSLPRVAEAKRVHNKMSRCTFLYGSPERAMKELVASWDTLRFTPGEHIVDVGAKGANLAGVLSLFYDNVNITLEDIDSSCLNDDQVDFVLNYYTGINSGKEPVGIMYRVVIGNDTSTTLPDAAYQKVFFINTYHEVTKPKQMLADLHRILAPGGILYVQEKVTGFKPLRRKDCGHTMPVEGDFLKTFSDAGFKLDKVKVTESHRKQGDHVRSSWYQFRKA